MESSEPDRRSVGFRAGEKHHIVTNLDPRLDVHANTGQGQVGQTGARAAAIITAVPIAAITVATVHAAVSAAAPVAGGWG
jgi:hypothetical protein